MKLPSIPRRSALARLVTALSLTGLLAGTGTAAAQADAPSLAGARLAVQIPTEPVKIRNVANGGAILPYGGGTASGTVVDMINDYPYGQEWEIEQVGVYGGHPTFKIENVRAASMCLTVKAPLPPDSYAYDTEIRPCTLWPTSDNQQWIITPARQGGNAYQIINVEHPTRGLTPYVTTTHWTGVKLRRLTNNSAFSWRLELQ